jgi:hypothetical protein
MYIAIGNSIGASSRVNAGGGGGGFTNTYSLAFDGVDDQVIVPYSASLDVVTGNHSLSFWMKAVVLNVTAVMEKGRNQELTALIINNKIYWGGTNGYYGGTTNMNDGNWHHIVFVATGTTSEIFIDGFSVATGGNKVQASANTSDFFIGTDVNGNNDFTGLLDEISIFNYALSSSEITSMYNSGVPNDLTSLNPTAWYRMGDNGSYKSPQWLIPENSNKDKVSNYSFSLDGIGDYIPVSGSILSSAGDMTISSWANFQSLAGVQGIFDSANYFRSGFNGGFSFRTNGTNLDVAFSNGTVFDTHNASAGLSTSGGWYHLAFTFNNTTKLGTFYVNGSSIDTYTFTGFDNADLVNGGVIGRAVRTNSFCFTGSLDEISIFNSELSSVDINSIYNSGVPTDLSSLSPVGYWRSENSTFITTWTVIDNGSSGSDGTSVNMTIEDRVGDAPNSNNNALSYNMTESDRETNVPT